MLFQLVLNTSDFIGSKENNTFYDDIKVEMDFCIHEKKNKYSVCFSQYVYMYSLRYISALNLLYNIYIDF